LDFSFRLLGTTRFLNLGECSDAATTFLFRGFFFTLRILSAIRLWLWSLPHSKSPNHSWASLHGLGVRTNLQPIALVCLPDMEHSFYSPNVLGMTRWLRSRPNMLDTHHNGCPYSEPDMESLAVLCFCGQYLYFDSAWKVSHQSLVRMVE